MQLVHSLSLLEKKGFPLLESLPAHQLSADFDWLLEDRPNYRFVAGGGGQGAVIAIELCEVYISD